MALNSLGGRCGILPAPLTGFFRVSLAGLKANCPDYFPRPTHKRILSSIRYILEVVHKNAQLTSSREKSPSLVVIDVNFC